MVKSFFKNLFHTLYKNSVIIMIVATLCVVLSVGYTTMHAKVSYTAKSEVLVHSPSLTDVPQNTMVKPDVSAIDTALEIFNSDGMFKFLTETELSNKNYSVEELDKMIEVERKGKDSLVLVVNVTCNSGSEAVMLAEAYTKSMQYYFSSFTMDFYVNTLSIDEDAVMNKPSIALSVIMGLVIGSIIGSIAVLLLDKFNQRLRSASDYRAKYSATLLGTVPDFTVKKEDK